MYPKRLLLTDILYNLIVFITLHAVFCLPVYYFLGIAWVYASYLLIIPFYICLFIRAKSHNIFIFTLAHGLIFLSFLFVPGSLSKIFYRAFISIIIIYSFSVRVGTNLRNADISIVVPPVIICIIGRFLNSMLNIQFPPVYFIISAGFAILCFIALTHIVNIDLALNNITEYGRQPLHSIVRFNNSVILLFILLIAGIMGLSQFVSLDSIFTLLLVGVWFLITFIVGVIASLFEETLIYEPFMMNRPVIEETLLGDPNALWLILVKAATVIAVVLLVVFAVLMISFMLYSFYKRFKATNQTGNDTAEFILPAYFSEKEKPLSGMITAPFFGRSKAARIRRLFIKKVRRYVPHSLKLNKHDTAQDISEKISCYEDISELTDMYEKARYGE